jgi:hypothetical protein
MSGQITTRSFYQVVHLIVQLLTATGKVMTCTSRHSELHYSAQRVHYVFHVVVRRN